MFKRFFSILMLLCAVSHGVIAKEIVVTGVISNPQDSSLLSEAWEFCCEKTAEFEEVVKNLSAKSKIALQDLITKVRGKVSADTKLQEVSKKYKALCDKYKILNGKEPKLTLHWLTQNTQGKDVVIVPEDIVDFHEFEATLTPAQLAELRASVAEVAVALKEAAETVFEELKDSDLVKELKKNNGDKNVTVSLTLD